MDAMSDWWLRGYRLPAYSPADRAMQDPWPPSLPGGLLASAFPDADLAMKAREDWKTEEWKRYAARLEQEGAERIDALRVEVLSMRKRLRRRGMTSLASDAKAPQRLLGLLSLEPLKRRGRPPGSTIEALAIEALQALDRLRSEDPRRRFSRKDGLAAAYIARGQRGTRAHSKEARATLNLMSKLHKNSNR
jgi:hypothetical protein